MFVLHHVAVKAYLASGLRLPVELSPAARAYRARHPERTEAGLAEVAAYAAFDPKPFVSKADNDVALLASMAFARKVQQAKELAARLRA